MSKLTVLEAPQLTEITLQNAPLTDLLGLMDKQSAVKKDFVINAAAVTLTPDLMLECKGVQAFEGLDLGGLGQSMFQPTKHAYGQMCDRLGVPVKYFQKMQLHTPELAADNINTWLRRAAQGEKKVNYFVRTFDMPTDNRDGIFRAFLSDNYLPIDNYDVVKAVSAAVMEEAHKQKIQIQIATSDVTETNMYVRFVCPDIEVKAPELLRGYKDPKTGGGAEVGDAIITGFVLRNSEVGSAKFSIAPRMVVLACKNGMIWTKESFERQHLGAKLNEGNFNWSPETRSKNLDLIISQAKDVVRKFCNKEYLGSKVKDLQDLGLQQLENPTGAVKHVATELGFSDEQTNKVFEYFLRGGTTTTAFDVSQAITYAAQAFNGDRRYELEAAAVSILPNIKTKFDRPFFEQN